MTALVGPDTDGAELTVPSRPPLVSVAAVSGLPGLPGLVRGRRPVTAPPTAARNRRPPGAGLALGDGVAAFATGSLLLAAPWVPVGTPPVVGAVVALVWVSLLGLTRSYETRATSLDLEDVRRVVRAGVGLAAALLVLTVVVGAREESTDLVTTAATLTAVGVALRVVGAAAVRVGRRSARIRVVVAGEEADVLGVLAELRATTGHAFELAAVCLPGPATGADHEVPVCVGFATLPAAVATHGADAVIVVPNRELDPAAMRRLGWRLETTGTQLFVSSGLLDVSATRATVRRAGTLPLLHVRHADLHGVRRLAKDVGERTAAAVAVVVLAPLLLLLVVLVRSTSDGPALFRQTRIGRDGHPFVMLKLRTMTVDAEARQDDVAGLNHAGDVVFKARQDPRVTRLGRVLRTYSLDELPQLLNVVRGDMSLVGPRPPLVAEVARYDPDAHRRLAVRPGITGLWQVSGRSDLTWEQTVRLDLRYVDNWSLGLDLLILARTVRAVLGHHGAY